MIVDDDHDDRFFFRNAVKAINGAYECREAQHGVEALEQLKIINPLPDFIFLDLNMPFMGGRECLCELKKDNALKHIPIVIYSTSRYEEDIQFARTNHAAHYLVKTADVFRLPSEIFNAMERITNTNGN
jgi:CheY-like chemotaxis protein